MNGPEYLLDTNVLIAFLSGRSWALSFIDNAVAEDSVFFISSITRMELLGFPNMTSDEETRILELLAVLQVQSIHTEIEDVAIQLRKSHRLKLPDAIVGATALYLNVTLVSADADFEIVDSLKILNPAK